MKSHQWRFSLVALPVLGACMGWFFLREDPPDENPVDRPAEFPSLTTLSPVQSMPVVSNTIQEQGSCCSSPADAPTEAELKELRAKAELANTWIPLQNENFDAFLVMSPDRQLDYITAYRNNSNLSDSALAFLKNALLEKRLGVTTRNAVANVLVANVDRFPQQQTLFEKMVNDNGESAVWREYALQHFAQLAFSSQRPEAIHHVLMNVALSGSSDMAATAMIQLSFLERNGIVTLHADYADALSKRLEDPKGSLASKMSMIGLIGSRRMKEHLDTVRRFSSSDQPSLRRVAFATLGLIGDDSDTQRLKIALADRDQSVSIAARSAYERLADHLAAH